MGTPQCPKCSSEMEAGCLADCVGGRAFVQGNWLEGAPEPSFWYGIKTKGKARLNVTTYRCTSCGYLESYANEAAG